MKFNYQKFNEFSKFGHQYVSEQGLNVDAANYYLEALNNHEVLDNYPRELFLSLVNFVKISHFRHYAKGKIISERSTKFFELVSTITEIKKNINSSSSILNREGYKLLARDFPICSRMFLDSDFRYIDDLSNGNELRKASVLVNIKNPDLFLEFIKEYEFLLLAGIALAKNVPEINLAVFYHCGIDYDMYTEGRNNGINRKLLGYRDDFLDNLARADPESFIDTWLRKDIGAGDNSVMVDSVLGVIDGFLNSGSGGVAWLLNINEIISEKCKNDLTLVNHNTLPIIANLITTTPGIKYNDDWLFDYIRKNPNQLNHSTYSLNYCKSRTIYNFKVWLNIQHILRDEPIPNSYKVYNFGVEQIMNICNNKEKIDKVLQIIFSQFSLVERTNFAQHFLMNERVNTPPSIFKDYENVTEVTESINKIIRNDKYISFNGLVTENLGVVRDIKLVESLISKPQKLSQMAIGLLKSMSSDSQLKVKTIDFIKTSGLKDVERLINEVKTYINHVKEKHIETNLLINVLNIMCKNPAAIQDSLELLGQHISEFSAVDVSEYPFLVELMELENQSTICLDTEGERNV